jgi:hypothetical protein
LAHGVGAAVCEPGAHGPVQCVAVDTGQQSAYRRFRRKKPLRAQWIGPDADEFEQVGRGVPDPLADRQQRGGPGQHRARGQCEHGSQSVPYSAWIARVGYLGHPLQKAGDFCRHGFGMLAELVKGRRDQR